MSFPILSFPIEDVFEEWIDSKYTHSVVLTFIWRRPNVIDAV